MPENAVAALERFQGRPLDIDGLPILSLELDHNAHPLTYGLEGVHVEALVGSTETGLPGQTDEGPLGRVTQDPIVGTALFQMGVVANKGAFQEAPQGNPTRDLVKRKRAAIHGEFPARLITDAGNLH